MKRLTAILLITTLLLGCTVTPPSDEYLSVRKYPMYGIFDESSDRSDKVCYRLSVLNVVLAVILVETIIVPVIVVGFGLFEPARMKRGSNDSCRFEPDGSRL